MPAAIPPPRSQHNPQEPPESDLAFGQHGAIRTKNDRDPVLESIEKFVIVVDIP